MPETLGLGSSAVDTLLSSVIDYAGTFPPASLELRLATSAYARAFACDTAWLLGRFVLAAGLVDRFEPPALEPTAAADRPAELAPTPWPISVVVPPPPSTPGTTVPAHADLGSRIAGFNDRWQGRAEIVAVEYPAVDAVDVDALDRLRDGYAHKLEIFIEVPYGPDCRRRIDAIASRGLFVKLRAGGVARTAFPSVDELIDALCGCAEAGVTFKATAGLHHALRGSYPVTAEPLADTATMHGFLNVLIAAALAYRGASRSTIVSALAETDWRAFSFTVDQVTWRGQSMARDELARFRRRFFRAFGSCSFDDPVRELRTAGLLA
jgi:hypothetical protein